MQIEHMQKKFQINQKKIKGGCQSGRKVVTHNSKSDLPLPKKAKKVPHLPKSTLMIRVRMTHSRMLKVTIFNFAMFFVESCNLVYIIRKSNPTTVRRMQQQ